MALDTDKFATYLRKHAAKRSQAHCARYVRRALEAGGANTIGHATDAKTYGPILLRNGFHILTVEDPEKFTPLKGDVVVIAPTQKGNRAGHIAGYDGKNWVSDFVQNSFWPGSGYAKEKPDYVVYRP